MQQIAASACLENRNQVGAVLELFQVIRPGLHHSPALCQMRRPVVSASIRIANRKRELVFDEIWGEAQHLVQDRPRHGAKSVAARLIFRNAHAAHGFSGSPRMLSDVIGSVQMVGRGLTKNPRNPLIALWYPKSKLGSCPRSCPSRLQVATLRPMYCIPVDVLGSPPAPAENTMGDRSHCTAVPDNRCTSLRFVPSALQILVVLAGLT
jgi:hypothetical protein